MQGTGKELLVGTPVSVIPEELGLGVAGNALPLL